MNPSPSSNAGVDQDDPMARDAMSPQQQRDLALLLLEQGQHEQRQRVNFNQALMAAAASTLPAVPINLSRTETRNAPVDASMQSGVPSTEFQREYLLELDRQRQRIVPQHQSQSIPSADFQRELLLDVERQRQQLQQSSQQQNLQMQLETSALLQQNLGRLLAAGLSQENISVSTGDPSGSARSTGIDSAELDRLLATESLLRSSRLQEAMNMLQNQGILLEDTFNRGSSNFSSANAAASCFFRPNDPILSQLLQSAVSSCASNTNGPITTGLQSIGHMGLLPGSITSIESPRGTASSAKRISDEQIFLSSKESKKQRATIKSGNASCFPLPARKHSRKISMKLGSFHALWNKLGDCALRQELFRRRLSRNFKSNRKAAH